MTLAEAFNRAREMGCTHYSFFSTYSRNDHSYHPFSYCFLSDKEENGMRLELAHYLVDMKAFTELERWNEIDLVQKERVRESYVSGLIEIDRGPK